MHAPAFRKDIFKSAATSHQPQGLGVQQFNCAEGKRGHPQHQYSFHKQTAMMVGHCVDSSTQHSPRVPDSGIRKPSRCELRGVAHDRPGMPVGQGITEESYSPTPSTRSIRRNRLHQLQFRQILKIDDAHRFAFRVHHDQVVDVALVEDLQEVHRQRVVADANGFAGHHLAERLV